MNQIIDGKTGLYGIVAHPIHHSISPIMHNCAFRTLQINDVYLAFDIEKNHFSQFMTSARVLPIKGFNVSMPYKQEIIQYLDDMTEQAKLCQAVNTVKNENGKLIGHITDGEGFIKACQQKNWDISHQKIIVLGAGGAALSIIVALATHQAKEIIVYNRSHKEYIKELNQHFNCSICLKSLDDRLSLKNDLKDAYLLVQATQVGMIPNIEECLIDESYFSPNLKVADLIYKPQQTKLLTLAQNFGLDVMNGEGMLLYQGALSFAFWTNQEMPIEKVKKILQMR